MGQIKSTFSFSVFFLLLIFSSYSLAQNTSSVKWNLVPPDSQRVSSDSGFVSGYNVAGSNIIIRDYTGVLNDGVSTGPLGKYQRWYLNANWPSETSQNNSRFIQFEVRADAGYTLSINSISFYINAGGTGNMLANFYYSTDTSFTSPILLNTGGPFAVSRDVAAQIKYSVQASVGNGQSFYFRIYPWLPGGSTNTGKYIYLQEVIISGITFSFGDTTSPSLPVLTTSNITNIKSTSAACGGNVTSDGGAAVTQRGVCWNTTENPSTGASKTSDGTGTGSYTSTLTNLKPGTTYYVRAYAVNSAGTNYGQQLAFTTNTDTTGALLAFPGAEGFGRYTSGGRGGRIIQVTNLKDDNNPGSFRYAINQSGPRIIVFTVSGTIMLNSDLNISNGNLTIAGQTAPGDGICIANHTVECKASNVIVRYLRFRLGDLTKEANDSFWGREQKNIIIDHCSFSWAIDENGSWYDNTNFTMQWCIYSESLYHSFHPKGDHGYGGIWGGIGATFHHNLIADNSSRNPRFNGARYISTHATELVDFRNNVIFNWGFNSAYGGESGNQNIINNYYKPGPATSSSKTDRIVNPSDPLNPGTGYSKWYVAGNYVEGNSTVSADNWNGGVQPEDAPLDSIKLNNPLPAAPVVTQSAQDAYNSVLQNAGANFPARDSADLRVVNEVKTGYAPFGATYNGGKKGIIDSQKDVGGWPVLKSLPAPLDSDHDGMPDDWEIARGLNPNDSTDSHKTAPDGYTYIEDYINGLVPQNIMAVKETSQIPSSLALLQNFPNPFNPNTKIEYQIPRTEKVRIEVFDLLGRRLAVLVDGIISAGEHNINFNASGLSSGVYIYRLSSSNQIISRKMIVIK